MKTTGPEQLRALERENERLHHEVTEAWATRRKAKEHGFCIGVAACITVFVAVELVGHGVKLLARSLR